MQKPKIHDKPETEAPDTSSWEPSSLSTPSRREWFAMLVERFGFLSVCLLTIGALAVLFIKSDVLLREPDTAPSQLFAPEQPVLASPSATLSITTEPASAAIFIEGEFVSLSPLQAYALAAGTHRISVQKQDYVSLDTVLTLADDPAVLHISLRAMEQATVVDESQDELPPELAAAETSQDTPPPTLEPPTSPESAPAEEQPAIIPEETPADQNQATPPSGDTNTDPADEDQSDTATGEAEAMTPEEPVVEVGELQVYSQPSGASVWLREEQVGITPLLLTEVEAGARQVTLRLDGYEPFTTTVNVTPQQRSEIGGPLTQRLGTLKILAKPWGNIYIDGKLHEREASIWYTAKLPPGNHRVRIEHPTLGKWEQVVVVSLEEERKIEVDYNKGNSPSQ